MYRNLCGALSWPSLQPQVRGNNHKGGHTRRLADRDQSNFLMDCTGRDPCPAPRTGNKTTLPQIGYSPPPLPGRDFTSAGFSSLGRSVPSVACKANDVTGKHPCREGGRV
uniref:Uncharacterized protein n=1 Tax=Physcomitrium patens TaxID=3218 RepID=A0A2K1JMK0_PHYPA|nr:hypothetical protein PHYPA_017593 [Physcomitrium patens]